ncbi:MAG: ABC transporter permease [Bacteroidales bacterium]|nr:ABC transporter permease [Bacteroidales bacterium]
MNNIAYALRTLLRKGRSNPIKIICLALGLAVGCLIIAKVNFESSYDTFFPDYERIYRINQYIIQNGEVVEYPQTPGAVAPAVAAEIPGVEAATRYSFAFDDRIPWLSEDKDEINLKVYMADSCFFDVFQLPILLGNPEDLGRADRAFVSETTAKKLGGIEQCIGQTLSWKSNPDYQYTIAGVFRDLPRNSMFSYDALASLKLFGKWSLNNWLGNDRYASFIKLAPGVEPGSLSEALRQMQERHYDVQELKDAGLDLSYTLTSLNDIHNGDKDVRSTCSLLSVLAIALIVISVLNYLLLVVSTIINRNKEIAVKKCYGASQRQIFSLTLSESAVHLLIALLLAAGLIFLFRGIAEGLLSAPLSALLSGKAWIIIAAICIAVLIITSLAPAYAYGNIPVSAAFRSHKKNNRVWKTALLVVQLLATGFIVAMLVTIARQYRHINHSDPGYAFENLYICPATQLTDDERRLLGDELKAQSSIEDVAYCHTLPIDRASGNNVYLPDSNQELFNIADLYSVSDNYFDVMEIPIIEGCRFQTGRDQGGKMMVSRKFVDKIHQLTDIKGSIVGHNFVVTEHCNATQPTYEVIGVYEDFRLGTARSTDERPSVVFFEESERHSANADEILIKLKSMDAESAKGVYDAIERMYPDCNLEATSYSAYMAQYSQEEKNLRDSITICSVIALIITLIGLWAYVQDNVNRRSKEIAVRRVNGAEASDIRRLFTRDISYCAIPALIVGAAGAYFASGLWLQKFSVAIDLGIFWFLIVVIALYAIVLAIVLIRASKAASANPTIALSANE